MNILVIGATGTVGREVCTALAGKGHNIRAGIHTPEKAVMVQETGAEPVLVDFSKPKTLLAAMQGIDRVFLATPFSADMVRQTKTVVDACHKASIRQIVKLSVMGAEIEPGIQVGRWHREAENIIRASNIPYTFLRPNFFMQNFITYLGKGIKDHTSIQLPAGEGKTSFIDVRDLGQVAAVCLTQPGHDNKEYTLTGPDSLSYTQAADIISMVIGPKVQYVPLSDEQAKEALLEQGMPELLAGAMLELYQQVRAGYAAEVTPWVEKLLGRKPTLFQRFVKDHRDAFTDSKFITHL